MRGRGRAATSRPMSSPARCCRRWTTRRSRPTVIGWSTYGFPSPISGASPTGAPITRWCGFAPSPNPQVKEQPMGAQKGKDLLLKIDGGAGFVTVAGLRSRRIAFNAERVDITHAGSVDRWRDVLAGAGVRRASISGPGLFKDADSDALVSPEF